MNFYDIAADWGPHFMPLSRYHDAVTLDTRVCSASVSELSLSLSLSLDLFVCLFVHDANNQFNVFVTSHCWRARVKYLHSPPHPPDGGESHRIRHFYLRKLTNWKWMEWFKKSEIPAISTQRRTNEIESDVTAVMNEFWRLLLILLWRLQMWCDFLRLVLLVFRLA